MAKRKASPTMTKRQVAEMVNAIKSLSSDDALRVERAVLRFQAVGYTESTAKRIVEYLTQAIAPAVQQ